MAIALRVLAITMVKAHVYGDAIILAIRLLYDRQALGPHTLNPASLASLPTTQTPVASVNISNPINQVIGEMQHLSKFSSRVVWGLVAMIGASALAIAAFSYKGCCLLVVSETSSCMAPTLNGGDLVFEKTFKPAQDVLKRYQVVVFRSPQHVVPTGIWIMRVFGLPGEQVDIDTNSIRINDSIIMPDGMPKPFRDKQWLSTQSFESSGRRQWRLGQDEIFVVGDNLSTANDSRFWGPLHLSNVISIVVSKAKGKQTRLNLDPVLHTTITTRDGPIEVIDQIGTNLQ